MKNDVFQNDARHDDGNTHGNANDGSRLVVIHTVTTNARPPSRERVKLTMSRKTLKAFDAVVSVEMTQMRVTK